MELAIFITIFASLLWAITNHIDKFLINGIDESGTSIKTLLIFSSFVSGFIFSIIWLIITKFSININIISLVAVLSASIIYILATYFYFKGLDKNDASIVVVMFQMIPVFSYILTLIFFKESLTIKQIVGSIIILSSAILISYNFDEKNNNSKTMALIFVTFSSFLFSLYFFLFDIGIRNSSYSSCAFWLQIGFLGQGIILLLIKSFRQTFINAIKNNGKRYFSINIINELFNSIANLLANYANVVIPLALVNVLNGFQGAFVFVLGVIGVKLLPKYFKEKLSKKDVIQKVSCIILSIIGLIVMFI